MAKENFEKAYARVRVYEGGNVDDPHDPGGRTSRGVTQAVYNAWCARNDFPRADVWKAPEGHIARIYKELYWDRCACDHLPAGVDFAVYDSAVNSGVSQAAKWAQRAINFTPSAGSGGFGYMTVQALQTQNDNDAVVAAMMSRRLATLKGLRTWKRYGKGWSARIANVQKIGQAWATGSVGPQPVNVATYGLMGNVKAVIEDNVVKPRFSTVQANVVTASTVVASSASDLAQQLEVAREWFSWMPYILGGLAIAAALASVIIRLQHAKAEKIEKGEDAVEVDISADDNALPVEVNDNQPVELAPTPAELKAS